MYKALYYFRSHIITQHKKKMDEIMDIMFAMEHEFEEAESEARQDFHSLRDELKNKVTFFTVLSM